MLRKLDEPIKFYIEVFEDNINKLQEESPERMVNELVLKAFNIRRKFNQDIVDEYNGDHKMDNGFVDSVHITYEIALNIQNNLPQALDLLNDVYSSWYQKLGRYHVQTIAAKFKTATVLKKQRNFECALEAFKEVYDGRCKNKGPYHLQTLNVKELIGTVYWHQEEYDLAYQCYSEISEAVSKPDGRFNYRSNKAKFWLGRILMKQEKYDDAYDIFCKIYEGFRFNLGDDHDETTIVKYYIDRIEEHREAQRGCFRSLLNSLPMLPFKQT